MSEGKVTHMHTHICSQRSCVQICSSGRIILLFTVKWCVCNFAQTSSAIFRKLLRTWGVDVRCDSLISHFEDTEGEKETDFSVVTGWEQWDRDSGTASDLTLAQKHLCVCSVRVCICMHVYSRVWLILIINPPVDKPVCYGLLFSDAAERTGQKYVLGNQTLI